MLHFYYYYKAKLQWIPPPTHTHILPLCAPGFAAKGVSGVSYTMAPVTSPLPAYSKILFSRKSRKESTG